LSNYLRVCCPQAGAAGLVCSVCALVTCRLLGAGMCVSRSPMCNGAVPGRLLCCRLLRLFEHT